MSDHMHETHEVYGLDGTRQDAREALALAAGLREDLAAAEDRIRNLEAECGREMRKIWAHISGLETDTPQARQAQYEADLAAADLAASGYDRDPPVGADRHGPGCLCPYCPDEDEPAEIGGQQ